LLHPFSIPSSLDLNKLDPIIGDYFLISKFNAIIRESVDKIRSSVMGLTPQEISQTNLTTHYLLVREKDGKTEFESAQKGTLWGGLKFLWLTKIEGYNANISVVRDNILILSTSWFSATQRNDLIRNFKQFQIHEIKQHHQHTHVFDAAIGEMSPIGIGTPQEPVQPLKRSSEPRSTLTTQESKKPNLDENEHVKLDNNSSQLAKITNNWKDYGFKSEQESINALDKALDAYYGREKQSQVLIGKIAITDEDLQGILGKLETPGHPSERIRKPRPTPAAKPVAKPAPQQQDIAAKQQAIRNASIPDLIQQAEKKAKVFPSGPEKAALPRHIEKALEKYTKEPLASYARKELEGIDDINKFLFNIALRELLNNTRSVQANADNLYKAHMKP
jgi:hypothetical protein